MKGRIGAVLVVVGLLLGIRAYNEAREEQDEAKSQREANRMVEVLAEVPESYINVVDETDYTLAITLGAFGAVSVLAGVILLASYSNDERRLS